MTKQLLLGLLIFTISCTAPINKEESDPILSSTIAYDTKLLDEDTYLYFIGYYKSFPVFDNIFHHELFISEKTGELKLIRKYDDNLKVLFTNDKGFVYFDKKTQNIIIHYVNEQEFSIHAGFNVFEMQGNNNLDSFFLVDDNYYIYKLTLPNKKIIKTIEKGSCLNLKNRYLYFSINSEEEFAASDIYRIDTSFTFSKETVLKKIQGDPWQLIENKWIMCMPVDYDEKLSVYDMEDKSFNVIGDYHENVLGYYSYQEKAMVIYSPMSFIYRIVKLE